MANAPHTGTKIPDEKLTRFLAAYLENNFNATKAAIAIGVSARTANANAHRYVAAIRGRIGMQDALDAAGLTVEKIAQKLALLIDAQTPKWNPAKEDWDYFEDGRLQLAVVDMIIRLRNLYPGEPPREEPLTVVLNFGDMKL